MVRDSFAIFMLSHGRANNFVTLKTLQNAGYTGKWYILLDDEDEQIDIYKEKFGEEHIKVFCKSDWVKNVDVMDNFDGNKIVVYARNAVNSIAKELGLKYFFELDDDYGEMNVRIPIGNHLPIIQIRNLDSIIEAFLDFLDSTNCSCIAWAQTGEMMGGINGNIWKQQLKRKAMNSFFFKVEDLPDSPGNRFIGRINEDVNWYIDAGKRGKVILQTAQISISQKETQTTKNGLTTAYRGLGTYVKSFYSILTRPDCVKISVLFSNHGDTVSHPRIHHKIDWGKCVPKIVSSKFRNNV